MAVYEGKGGSQGRVGFWFERRGRMGQRTSGMKHRAHVLSATILVLVFASCAVAQSPTEIEELRLAAEQGDADAQYELGRMYNKGEGVPPDGQEAVRWLQLAAEQGNANAQNKLGVMYANGEGVSQDYQEAGRWFRLAAEQGNALAQNNLGRMYNKGEGMPQNYGEAARWYRLAAEQGNANAQAVLGAMYVTGEGVPQDYVQSHKWINLAASQTTPEKAEDNRSLRDQLAELMTAPQVADAQRLAREWQPKTWEQLKANPFRW